MKKILINNKMGDYEKEHGKASYKTLVDMFITDLVLCNNIVNIDDNLFDNIKVGEIDEDTEIFQYYLCNVDEWTIETLKELTKDSNDIILAYSDVLECDVLMVDHWGTSWDYVLTDIPLTDDINDCGI